MKSPFAKACVFIVWLIFAKNVYAQVPVEKEPHHKIVFENELVRVMDLVVSPGDTTLWHTHSAASAVVFLSPSTFAIQNAGKSPAITTVKPGDAVYRNYDEVPVTHTVWCADQNVFRCLVVERKNHSLNKSHNSAPPQAKLLWQNANMSAHRLDLTAHSSCPFPKSSQAYLLINLSETVTIHSPGKEITLKEGRIEFIRDASGMEIRTNTTAGIILLQLN